MPSKRKKSASWPKRIYTTKKITEITEQRRLEEEAKREAESMPKAVKVPKNRPDPLPEDLNLPSPTFSSEVTNPPVKEENVMAMKSKNSIPINAIIGSLVLILSLLALFLIVSSKSSESWVNVVAGMLNAWIVYGSFFILNILQGSCTLEGAVLKTHYYQLSLQGDLVALYSLELLIVFAALFAFFQNMTWIKKGMVFISLIPLAIIANISRVVVAFGLAFNDGAISADRYFHGILVGVVFILIILGLIIFEFLFSPDSA